MSAICEPGDAEPERLRVAVLAALAVAARDHQAAAIADVLRRGPGCLPRELAAARADRDVAESMAELAQAAVSALTLALADVEERARG